MKTIQEVYEEYNIMPNLQQHMYRVAAVGEMIIDNLSVPVNKQEVISALLLHDMGNIIKFKLGSIPEFLEPQGLEYWQNVQKDFQNKYGLDEHQAHVAISRELGMSETVSSLVDGIDFQYMCNSSDSDNWEQKICSYADLRVYPHGVVSLDTRLEDGRVRYNISQPDERWDLITCAQELEQQVFAQCTITPDDITDDTIASYMEKYPNMTLAVKDSDN